MIRTIWLASYPKSGSTWLRLLLANILATDGQPVDINRLSIGEIASGREDFDFIVLIDSGLLTHDEIDNLRPRAHTALAREAFDDGLRRTQNVPPVRFVKAHDAYTINPAGQPIFGGLAAAQGAIVVVRDPRDVAPSFAHQYDLSIDDAITFMADDEGALSKPSGGGQALQLRHKLRTWSEHVASWLDQTDIPVHLIRYEQLHEDTPEVLRRALVFAGLPASEEKINGAVTSCEFKVLRQQELQNGFRESLRREAQFFRRGEAGSWRDELSRDQVIRIEATHWQTMLRLGYGLSAPLNLQPLG